MAQNPVVTIEMENGDIMKAELYPEIAPNTVNNFISLINHNFYDGVIFHRVIKGFMLQGGDPDGTGMGGPGYSIKGEFGIIVRAIESTPGSCFKSFLKPLLVNSPLIEYPGPPIPVPSGSPP